MGNGELLKVAEEAGFDVLITADRSMPYQQKLEHRKIAILILSSNERELIAAHLGQIDAAIGTAPSGIFLTVDLGS